MSPPTTAAMAFGKDAADAAHALADQTERLADHLRATADLLAKGDGKASIHAADLVNDYNQRVGNGGMQLWTIVSTAAHADREFNAASTAETRSELARLRMELDEARRERAAMQRLAQTNAARVVELETGTAPTRKAGAPLNSDPVSPGEETADRSAPSTDRPRQ